jgi:hypothetical protein
MRRLWVVIAIAFVVGIVADVLVGEDVPGFIAVLSFVGGIVIAYRFANERGAFGDSKFDFPKITLDQIEGDWHRHSSSELALEFETPSPGKFSHDPNTGVTVLESQHRDWGTFKVHHLPESNPFWNKWVPAIYPKDARQFIAEEKHLPSYTQNSTSVGPVKVHRFRFSGKESPTSLERVALIRMFSTDDRTLVVMWVGPGRYASAKEIRYFFQQFKLDEIAYTE